MDSKIIALIAGSFLLTGCVTSKVERLHSTTTQLSTDIDNYVAMTNRVIDLNQRSYLDFNKNRLIKSNLMANDLSGSEGAVYPNDTVTFNTNLVHIYNNQSVGDKVKQQNKYISEYFKKLPSLLEDKDIGKSIEGLINNVDILNQVIEQNLVTSDEFKGRLKPNEASLIESTLNNGFKYYQYHSFRKAIDRHYDVLLKALELQKSYNYKANEFIFFDFNQQFHKQQKALVDSYIKQHIDAVKLEPGERIKVNYSNDDFSKITEMVKQPFILTKLDVKTNESQLKPDQHSAAYIKSCSQNRVDEFRKRINDRVVEVYPFNAKLDSDKNTPLSTYVFDVEQAAKIKGEIPVCALIDIIGLLKEKRYYQVESVSLSRGVADYNKMLDFAETKLAK